MTDLVLVPEAQRLPAVAYLGRLGTAESRRTMASALRSLIRLAHPSLLEADLPPWQTYPWHELRAEHTAVLRAKLSTDRSPQRGNLLLAALKGVLREAWRLGQVGSEEYHRAVDLPPIRGSTLPRGRALSIGELRALFDACQRDPTPAGSRDTALFAVLYGSGLRRAEAVALDVPDVGENGLAIRAGKGRKARMAPYAVGEATAVASWLELRQREGFDGFDGPVFFGVRKGGKLRTTRLSSDAVRRISLTRAREAGIPAFAPHDLRRSYLTHALEAGVDVLVVQRLAGHSSPVTTAKYDRRKEVAEREAASRIVVPIG